MIILDLLVLKLRNYSQTSSEIFVFYFEMKVTPKPQNVETHTENKPQRRTLKFLSFSKKYNLWELLRSIKFKDSKKSILVLVRRKKSIIHFLKNWNLNFGDLFLKRGNYHKT